MTNATKIFLALSVIGFAVGGIVDFGNFAVNPAWTVAMPVGVIFLGLFLIWFVLEKEMAAFDTEETKKFAIARQNVADRLRKEPRNELNSSHEN
jgi:hypothetical protein